MGFYAIVVPAWTGHVNPMLALADALRARGHRIAFLSPLASQAKITAAGFEFLPIAAPEFPAGEWERLTGQLGQMTGRKANRFSADWLSYFVKGTLRDLPGFIEKECFDGVLMDQLSLGTESICQVMRIPLAVASCAAIFHTELRVPPLIFTWPYDASLRGIFRNLAGYLVANSGGFGVVRRLSMYRFKHRLAPMGPDFVNELNPSLVQVAQLPACLDFPRRRLPKHFHYTAPWIPKAGAVSFPWERLDGRRLIYASLGTLQNNLQHAFRMIAEACAGIDAQLALALGNKNAEIPTDFPENAIVVGYAPQPALIEKASLVITHGGLNTTLEALNAGKPLIALPITNDQPGVAGRIKHAGVGEFIEITKLNTEALRQLIEKVLANDSYASRARQLQKAIQGIDGPAYAAELIEEAFVTRRRIERSELKKVASPVAPQPHLCGKSG